MNTERIQTAARLIDVWKVTRRTTLVCYGYLVFEFSRWFISLPDPTSTQVQALGIVIGGGAAVFGFYSKAPNDWSKQNKHMEVAIEEPTWRELEDNKRARNYE